jgi:hypothetical protein
MKLTQSQIKQIIKEELQATIGQIKTNNDDDLIRAALSRAQNNNGQTKITDEEKAALHRKGASNQYQVVGNNLMLRGSLMEATSNTKVTKSGDGFDVKFTLNKPIEGKKIENMDSYIKTAKSNVKNKYPDFVSSEYEVASKHITQNDKVANIFFTLKKKKK